MLSYNHQKERRAEMLNLTELVRLDDHELIEFLITDAEERALEAADENWDGVDALTDDIEIIKTEIFRRM